MNKRFYVSSDINRDLILEILRKSQADVAPVNDDNDELIACTELGWKVFIRFNRQEEMIVFHALFHVDPDVSMKRKLIFANRMSRELILLNVCLLDKVSLLAKYQIPYSGGFSPRFLVNALRRFVELTKYVAREVDRRGLNSGKS